MKNAIILLVITKAEPWRFGSGVSGVVHMAKEIRLSGISSL